MAEPTAQADSAGAPCMAHSVSSGSCLSQHLQEPRPLSHTEAPRHGAPGWAAEASSAEKASAWSREIAQGP